MLLFASVVLNSGVNPRRLRCFIMDQASSHTKHVTILLSGGLIAPRMMADINSVAVKYNLTLYLTTAQNLRLLGATEENEAVIKKELTGLGVPVKAAGRFPKPKVCVGRPYCMLGVTDTFSLADKIMARYGDRSGVKPKFKIAVSGCPACCGGSMIADIGIVATRKGYDLYVGGKGGPFPKMAVKVAKRLSEDEVVEAVGRLADFHDARTSTKQRMFKLIEEPDFPYTSEK